MERMTSKLTGAFVVLLLFAAAVATANSQEQPKASSIIYGIDSDGTLKWYRHDGAETGATAWQGANNVGGGWNDYQSVFPGGANIIYGIKADGTLEWRQHKGVRAGSDEWGDTKIVGRGWNDFKQVFSGGGGIIYAMTQEGKLLWYKHNAYLTGAGLETRGAWAGPREVGSGWNSFKQVFPAGNGIVFAITQEGKLLWYRHIDFVNGVKAWEGPREVGRGWGDFKNVFSSGDGVIYAITQDGKLQWRKYNGYMTGGGYDTWQGPTEVGTGWGDFLQAFGLLPGSSSPAPEGRPRTSDATSIDNFGKRDAARDKVYADSLKAGAEPTSNEIRCRGYSGTGGSEYVFFTINSRPSPTGETIITYEIAFTPGLKAAGSRGEGLRPGECSFVYRPISGSGPYRIRFETVANAQLKQQLHGTPVDRSPTAAERFPDAQTIPAYLKDPNHYWSFFGAMPAGSFFAVTGHKFWKPDLEVRPDDSIRTKDNPYVLTPKKPE